MSRSLRNHDPLCDPVVGGLKVGGSLPGGSHGGGVGSDAWLPGDSSLTDFTPTTSEETPKLVATIPVGSDPDGGAYDGGKGEVLLANQGSSSVSVISDAIDSVVATVAGYGEQRYGFAYDGARG